MKLNVATCQFSVEENTGQNLDYVLRQMKAAKGRGAHVAHFSEVCLPGYAGVDIKSMKEFDWDRLQQAHQQIVELARELKMWVIVGSAHQLVGRHKPHNSLYIIDDKGCLVDRYDKMFCTGERSGKSGDLAHYSPGSHFSVFEIRGVRCGALICHDFRYDELYREYKKLGVQLMFHSYHNARMKPAKYRSYNIWGTIVPPTMQTYAANNFMWISSNNSATPMSSWPSFFVRPDGIITGKLKNNRAGVLLSTVDTRAKIYDASVAWRDRAMKGVLHSGKLVRDSRSTQRKAF
jgi:predicted amidohydrolase